MDRRNFLRSSARCTVGAAALAASSVVVASTNNRSLLHIEAGNSEWEPTSQELEELVRQFQLAPLDPNGGIIATRDGVRVHRL